MVVLGLLLLLRIIKIVAQLRFQNTILIINIVAQLRCEKIAEDQRSRARRLRLLCRATTLKIMTNIPSTFSLKS